MGQGHKTSLSRPQIAAPVKLVERIQARWADVPPWEDLTDAHLRDLFQVTRQRLGDAQLPFYMKNVHARALHQPASTRVTLGFFTVYLAAFLLTLVTASLTRLGADAGQWPLRIRQAAGPAAPE